MVFDEHSEITAMISAEGEEVPLKKRINPNAANVSVEYYHFHIPEGNNNVRVDEFSQKKKRNSVFGKDDLGTVISLHAALSHSVIHF